MAIKLGVDIDGNAAGFATALNKAKADAKSFVSDIQGGVFKNVNTGIAGFVSNWKTEIIATIATLPATLYKAWTDAQDKAKEIKIGSIRTGLDPQQFQHVQNVTESAGGDISQIGHAFDHIAKAQQEVKAGSVDLNKDVSKLQDAFVSLGVNLSELDKASPQALFFKIAASLKDAAAEGRVTGEQMAALMEILGRGGVEMLPVFAKGFSGEAKGDKFNFDNEEIQQLLKVKEREAKSWFNPSNIWGMAKYGFRKTYQYLDTLNEEMDPLLKQRRAMENPEQEVEDVGPAFARRQNLRRWQEADRAAIEHQKTAKDEAKLAQESKKVEEQIAAERLKSGTPEEQRAALLDSIRQHEQEIADIRMYQEAGAFSETEARLRMDREELDIIKEQNALKQAERSDANKDADHWKRIGMIDRIQSSSATKPANQNDGTAAVNQNIDFIESQISAGDAAMNAGNMGEEQVQEWLRQREVLRARQRAAERSIARKTQSSERVFGIGGIDITREQNVSNVPQEGSPEFIGPQAEDFNTVFERMIQEQRWRELAPSLMTSPLGNPGGTALVPAQPDSESTRRTLTLLEQSNNAQREMQVSLRRLENALA